MTIENLLINQIIYFEEDNTSNKYINLINDKLGLKDKHHLIKNIIYDTYMELLYDRVDNGIDNCIKLLGEVKGEEK